MAFHGFLLLFSICGSTLLCEDGFVRARSCKAALAFVEAGLRPGQRLHLIYCSEIIDEKRGE